MTQRTRKIVELLLIGLSILCIVMFVAQHFMNSPRPSWHRDLAWLALAFVFAAETVRGRRRRRMRNLD
jgi:hypothetical protein